MRFVALVVACAGVLLAAAGCNPVTEDRLVSFGIGTKLPNSDIATTTYELETYLRYLCAQTDMGHLEGVDAPVECEMRRFGAAASTLLVRAGFNDIDRRCDSYLAWLNSRRRNQNAFLAQITDTRNFTEALLLSTGVSATPIAIVGLALGLASNTFTNYYSRLILEVEKSTVEVLVREKRLHYRDNFNKKMSGRILFKPDIVFVLREYLLICTPHFIENLVNQRARDSVAGNTPPDKRDPEQITASIVSRGLIKSIPAGGARGALSRTGPEEEKIGGAKNAVERKISIGAGQTIQANLCVTPAKGYFGSKTRAAIGVAKRAANQSRAGTNSGKLFANEQDEIKTPTEMQYFLDSHTCSKDATGKDRIYKTTFEKYRFADEAAVTSLQRALKVCDSKVTETGIFDKPTRAAIAKAKGMANAQKEKTFAQPKSDSLSEASYNFILGISEGGCKPSG